MQIQLKQTEIMDALRQYITQQGISLVGKSVDIAFTAGRKEGGLTAEVIIEDRDIPGFTTDNDPVQLSLVPPADTGTQTTETVEPAEDTVVVVEQEFPVEPKTTSLFS